MQDQLRLWHPTITAMPYNGRHVQTMLNPIIVEVASDLLLFSPLLSLDIRQIDALSRPLTVSPPLFRTPTSPDFVRVQKSGHSPKQGGAAPSVYT